MIKLDAKSRTHYERRQVPNRMRMNTKTSMIARARSGA
jgi:hypothetical protein